MKNEGKRFEEDWKKSFDHSKVYFFRIKDSATAFSGGTSSFTSKNPYDCFVFYERNFVAIELKSTKGTSFSFETERAGSGHKMIKQQQVDDLLHVSKFNGAYAGIVFNLRTAGHTYWMDIKNFDNFCKNTTKVSINERDIIDNGGILIEQKLLKVRYKYSVMNWLNGIIEQEV